MNLAHLEYMEKRKSVAAAYILLWTVGFFGAHRWYLGRERADRMLILAIASLLLCVIVVGIVGVIALTVWVIRDFFRIEEWVMDYNMNLIAELGLE